MFELGAVQDALKEYGLDAWLLYDFKGSNPLARKILEPRRPQAVLPTLLLPRPRPKGSRSSSSIRSRSGALDHLPGSKRVYLRWQELEDAVVEGLVKGRSKVAMEYSPGTRTRTSRGSDAGTVELVRSFGAEVVPSGDLVGRFESTWDDEQWAMHQTAAKVCREAYDVAFGLIAERVRRDGSVMETEVQKAILDHFAANGLTTDGPPIVGVGSHSGDPHYETTPETDAAIKEG